MVRVTDFCVNKNRNGAFVRSDVVRMTGVEPARLAAQEPKSCVYANFTTSA